uniref:tRNA-specific 2-thiouridylase MnmA n=1 Tax=candidate division WOR-3 bacterium TaxID=2052148 RepID=A0A7C4X9T8_UNCW3
MKVLVALSGGVDSSVAATLLKENNYSVSGAIMIFKGVLDEDIENARNVCEVLKIPFYQFDFSNIYQKEIVENFISAYQSGHTPNPCVLCNQLIKFGLFLKRAIEMGFDKIATGHYARVVEIDGKYLLIRGKDKNEQSYFLYRLNQSQLSRIILPLGDLTKEEVRRIAKKMELPTAHRRKSQDVCFLPDTDYIQYLKGLIPEKKGPVFNKYGEKIGEHRGIFQYTYGQRKRLGISSGRPLYVMKIDPKNNAIYVGEKEDVYKKELIAGSINFITNLTLNKPLTVFAKARYFAPLSKAVINNFNGKVRVVFEKPQWALTPGQSVVFYQNDTVLGGGIIEEVIE